MDAEDFFFSISVQTSSRAHTATCRMDIGTLCQRQRGRSLDHPTPHSVEVKHRFISLPRLEWHLTRRPLPPHLTLNLVKHNGNYILHSVTYYLYIFNPQIVSAFCAKILTLALKLTNRFLFLTEDQFLTS
jgi:hypothetical protein